MATVLYLAVVVGAWALWGLLTAVGERHRGGRWPSTVVAAVFFPIAWVVWYLRGERPYSVAR